MQELRHFSVSGVVIHEGQVLLARHTYGPAKGRLLIPGGHVEEGEMPSQAIVREVLEETGVIATARRLVAMRFRPHNWWAVFAMEFESGQPIPHGRETSEAAFMDIDRAMADDQLTAASKHAIRASLDSQQGLSRSAWVSPGFELDAYSLFLPL